MHYSKILLLERRVNSVVKLLHEVWNCGKVMDFY